MKKLSIFKNSKIPSHTEGADVDVTPIMNMFIILVPFLVSMAVFTHLATIEFNLPSNINNSQSTSPKSKPKLKMTTVLKPKYVMITYGESIIDSIAINENKFDSLRFYSAIKKVQDSALIKDEAIIAVNDSVKIEVLVKVMDKIRDNGFKKLSVSGAM